MEETCKWQPMLRNFCKPNSNRGCSVITLQAPLLKNSGNSELISFNYTIFTCMFDFLNSYLVLTVNEIVWVVHHFVINEFWNTGRSLKGLGNSSLWRLNGLALIMFKLSFLSFGCFSYMFSAFLPQNGGNKEICVYISWGLVRNFILAYLLSLLKTSSCFLST